MLIMAGSDDQVVDVGRHAIRLHEQIPHSELSWYRGQGTWCIMQCPAGRRRG